MKKKSTKQDLLRYPNLSTVLMVEKCLEKNKALPIKISELKRELPKQVMHQTLLVVLDYLFVGGKIIYGPKGMQWVYSTPEHLKKMMRGALEI